MELSKPIYAFARLAAAILCASIAIGCSSATAPGDQFILVSINGAPLPVPVSPGSAFLVQGASLTLFGDGRALSRIRDACDPALPPGTCTVGQNPIEITGTYSRQTGVVTYDGVSYPATFGANDVAVTFNSAAGTPIVWQYRR
jgi:hypothetical protein